MPLRFVFLVVLAIHFAGLNKAANGDGMGYYLGNKSLPLPGTEVFSCLALDMKITADVSTCAKLLTTTACNSYTGATSSSSTGGGSTTRLLAGTKLCTWS